MYNSFSLSLPLCRLLRPLLPHKPYKPWSVHVQPRLSEGDCRLFLFLWPLACVAAFEHSPPTPHLHFAKQRLVSPKAAGSPCCCQLA